MKKAKLVAVAVEVHCPHCEAPMGNPHNGSFMWERSEVAGMELKKFPARCLDCGKDFMVAAASKVEFA